MANKKMIAQCPVCNGDLAISRLSCCQCETQIETRLEIPPFFRLPADLRELLQSAETRSKIRRLPPAQLFLIPVDIITLLGARDKDRPTNSFPFSFPLTLPSPTRGEVTRKSCLSVGP